MDPFSNLIFSCKAVGWLAISMANIYHFITIRLDFQNNSFCCCVTKPYATEIKKVSKNY